MTLLEELRRRIKEAMQAGIEDRGALSWVLGQIDEIEEQALREMKEDVEHSRN